MRRKLFWRIYLMLLASLVMVALLGAACWKLVGSQAPSPWVESASRILGALLPPADAPEAEQAQAIARLAQAVSGELKLEAADGRRIAEAGTATNRHLWRLALPDGRRLYARVPHSPADSVAGLVAVLGGVCLAVGMVAFPVAKKLTRRLERLRSGVEAWGAGALSARVPVQGGDEIAALARSFNAAAARIERLVESHQALLANASHELRSPLARLRVALEMQADAPTPAREREIERNLAELDALIDEILLSSRLDHLQRIDRPEPVDLLALAAEEASRTGAGVAGQPAEVTGDPRLLRRLVRNLVENAAKHGAPPVEVTVTAGQQHVVLTVSDRGAGVAEAERERIFEPFHRPAGATEGAGGWGLGLALVRQIAERHGGRACCLARAGGGTEFRVELPGKLG